MKISGFTIIRNAIKNDYPVVEAIESVLPLVDEMIVSIGNSEDKTTALIGDIPSEKIKIIHSVWDPALHKGGEVLAIETNKALQHISPDSDWVFYIQADEVVHEKYHPVIRQVAEKYLGDKRVEGLLFRYLHFYGTYDYVGDSRKWYDKEVRIIRNDKTIQSYKDAQGFRKNGEKLQVKLLDAAIYHYGYVKSPQLMEKKLQDMGRYWSSEGNNPMEFRFDYADFDSLEKFTGSHPAVMEERIAQKNWQIDFDIKKKKFSLKDRMLYWLEKKSGKRLFDFRNYKII